ncbi:glycosyltransferase family 2 protein [bacterium]|nr:glycosyltransferase family 2 protein [bacterium]
MRRPLAIVPAFNEQDAVQSVLADLACNAPAVDVLVVNDGSTDATAMRAREAGATVVTLPVNLGIGGAVQTGFRYALDHGYAVALQFDGDGQHCAAEIAKLVAPIEAGTADAVIGSRFLGTDGYKSTPARRAGIRLFEAVNRLLIHQRITDNTSGFRAYNGRAIGLLAREYPHDYPEPEAVILMGRNGLRIAEVPVSMRERAGGASSIRGVRAAYYMVKVLIALFVTVTRAARKERS